jgi:histidyl-tRNA synthetase
MIMQKPSIPRGTRDFGPEQMVKRTYIFDTIRRTFQRFGFQPLETPTLENLSVLMGKYGEEGDQLLFKVLNSGNFLDGVDAADLEAGYKKLTFKVAEKGLRYDLTVPFARYVAMNRGELTFPFKRYQIQPVWRADRPQKGRYREFYQCDADVVGTDSLVCEAEIVAMLHEILTNLHLPDFCIKINNRKILSGIAEVIGVAGMETALFVAIDKLDKIGKEKVEQELREKGLSERSLQKLQPIFRPMTSNREAFENLQDWLATSAIGMKGVRELERTWRLIRQYGLSEKKLQLDITLARGLSYYTGAIFEVKALQADGSPVNMGSISGGGRYDNLTAAFGVPGLSGVGISLGVDRIYDVMEELSLFPENAAATTRVLLTQFDADSEAGALPLLRQLRDAGHAAELYPEAAKLKKQLDYADRKRIPYVVLIGPDERAAGKLTLKNMHSGEQSLLSTEELLQRLSS